MGSQWHFELMATSSIDASLIMTRVSAGLLDESIVDKSTLLNLELRRHERRRNLRYRTSIALESDKGHPDKCSNKSSGEREAKSVDEYAKELNQWLKKMRCTGVTGVRLESFVDIKIGVSEEPLDPSSPSLEPYPHLWKEKFTYKGYKDECGRLKGKAFIELENGDTISGSFHEGLRHGECRIETGKNGINFLVGNYVRDQLEGRAKFGLSSGQALEGYFKNSILHGFARHFDAKGRLTFIAHYKNGIKHGVCWKIIRGGGVVVGRVNAQGKLSGMRIAYLYPDFKTALLGSFQDGVLEAAKATTLKTVIDDRGMKIPVFNSHDNEDACPIYKREVSSYDHVTFEPKLRDPYESSWVKVQPSSVEGADEGLFTRQNVEPNTILSFYNGIRLQTHEMTDMPDWADNAYRIFDPTRKNGTIDIPKEFIESDNYCATLAHKTNHSFAPNAELVIFDHPRFGLIPCILSTQDIPENQEVFVHYGYELDDCPVWYEDSWNKGCFPIPPTFKEWSYYAPEQEQDTAGIPVEKIKELVKAE